MNNDGKLDLAIPNRNVGMVTLLLNKGNGAFARADYVFGSAPNRAISLDVNDDSKPDLVTANQYPSAVKVLLNSCLP
jgi:hypothetical protein